METEAWSERDDSAAPCCITDSRKIFVFLVTKATDRQHVFPESLVLALTRLRDFLVERGVTSLSLSLPVYDPNRGKLHPKKLYTLAHVIISHVIIFGEVCLHRKYYLSIC